MASLYLRPDFEAARKNLINNVGKVEKSEREIRLQNAPDGVNREQAVAYHQWAFDLLLLPLLAARAIRAASSGGTGTT